MQQLRTDLPCHVARNGTAVALLLDIGDAPPQDRGLATLEIVAAYSPGHVRIELPEGSTEELPAHVAGWLATAGSIVVILMARGRSIAGGYEALLRTEQLSKG